MASVDLQSQPDAPALFAFPVDNRLDTFTTELKKRSPLISLDLLKAHLVLIGAFAQTLNQFDPFIALLPIQEGLVCPPKLRSFLLKASHRLELWLTHVICNDRAEQTLSLQDLPPLDVALVLQAYMLSPHRYFEDTYVRFPGLASAGAYPLVELASQIVEKDGVYVHTPSLEQVAHWEKLTGVPFDFTAYSEANKSVSVTCPFGGHVIQVPWENDGRGYGEASFSHMCQDCNKLVTADVLCISKLLADILNSSGTANYRILRGTLLDSRGEVTHANARRIAQEVLKALDLAETSDSHDAASLLDMTLDGMASKLRSAPGSKLRPERIETLLRPYTQYTMFTPDIARTAFLLRNLHQQLVNSGYCSAKYLASPSSCKELGDVYSDYYSFLELAVFPEHGRISPPTSQMDLLWHTHQLMGPRYKDDSIALIGSFLDHISFDVDHAAWVQAQNDCNKRLNELTAPRPRTLSSGGTSMSQNFLLPDDDIIVATYD